MNPRKIILFSIMVVLFTPLFSQGAVDLKKTVDQTKSPNVVELMKSIHFLESRLQIVEDGYTSAWKEQSRDIQQFYDEAIQGIKLQVPEIWETDAEFKRRIAREENEIIAEMQKKIEESKNDFEAEKRTETEIYSQWVRDAYENLHATRYLAEDSLVFEALEYKRNERKWPLRISSTHPLVTFEDLGVTIDFEKENCSNNSEISIREEIIDFDAAVQAKKLEAKVGYKIERDRTHNRFVIGISEVVIINTVNNVSYNLSFPELLLTNAYVVEGENINSAQVKEVSVITNIEPLFPTVLKPNSTGILAFKITPQNTHNMNLQISTISKPEITLALYDTITIPSKIDDYILNIKTDDGLFEKQIPISVKYSIGDIGPAGGIVFYDAGDYSKGWRYMEAAPVNNDYVFKSVTWYEDSYKYDNSNLYKQVQTETRIGSGLQNSLNIASYLKDNDSVVQVCFDYETNGYSDWFLPSKDELNALIAFVTYKYRDYRDILDGFTYWSSSLSGIGYLNRATAWMQYVYNREQEEQEIYQSAAVQPVRYF